jgi:hypothetical protein
MNRAGWWSHLTALLTALDHLAERLMAFVAEWNAHAHPFNWSTKSAAKVSHGQVPSSASLGSSHMNSASFFCGCVLRGGH